MGAGEMTGRVSLLVLLGAAVLGLLVSLWMHRHDFDQTRLPSGAANVRTYHYPATWSKQLKGRRDVGHIVFHSYCASCHGPNPQVPVNAPMIGDKKVWAALKRLGVSHLLSLTIEGVNAMPARGGCFECSDDQLKAAIVYMIRKSSP